jgi:hypothetical protein
MALPGRHRPPRNRGRIFNIDLINQLEGDSRAAAALQSASPRFDQFV